MKPKQHVAQTYSRGKNEEKITKINDRKKASGFGSAAGGGWVSATRVCGDAATGDGP